MVPIRIQIYSALSIQSQCNKVKTMLSSPIFEDYCADFELIKQSEYKPNGNITKKLITPVLLIIYFGFCLFSLKEFYKNK